MAEDAINNKEFEKAVDYYEQGLDIEPLWPEGQFNAALLHGELKDYENAALHMKRYLELVPAPGTPGRHGKRCTSGRAKPKKQRQNNSSHNEVRRKRNDTFHPFREWRGTGTKASLSVGVMRVSSGWPARHGLY